MDLLVGEMARAFLARSKLYSLHRRDRRRELTKLVTVIMIVLAHRPAVLKKLLASTEAEAHRLVPPKLVAQMAAQKTISN